jgi:predicted PurR-regulated permease PerM
MRLERVYKSSGVNRCGLKGADCKCSWRPFNCHSTMRLQTKAFATTSKQITVLQAIVFVSVILYFGRDIFIPLAFAMLFSFVLYPVCAWLERRGMGRIASILVAMACISCLGALVVFLLAFQLTRFLNEWPTVYAKLVQLVNDTSQLLTDQFGVTEIQKQDFVSKLSNQSGGSVISLIGGTISASAYMLLNMVLVPVYVILILGNRAYWVSILSRIFPAETGASLRKMISLTINTYYSFIKGMALVYLIVGVLNSIGLMLLGVPHAILFGLIASVLTFIPYAGIVVGSLLPMAMAWITFDSIWYPVGVVAIFTFVQYLEANIIFPWAVSIRLNINTLIMLITIFAGGLLWGMAGMILFVPFIGIAKLIADHNPKWKTISMVLGTG